MDYIIYLYYLLLLYYLINSSSDSFIGDELSIVRNYLFYLVSTQNN